MKKYAKLIIALGLAGGIMLTGCQKNESGSAEPTATPEPTEAAEEVTQQWLQEYCTSSAHSSHRSDTHPDYLPLWKA